MMFEDSTRDESSLQVGIVTIMISLQNITKAFGDKVLFDSASLMIREGSRIGLVGPNGSGKSTLFSMILGRAEPDAGEIERPTKARFGYLAQEPETVNLDKTVFELATELPEDLKVAEQALHEIEQRIHQLDQQDDAQERSRLLLQMGHLQSSFEMLGGYELEHRAEEILCGLGFRVSDFKRPARELSGGWLMRISLARLLLLPQDVLLLDEPTNHLDLESVLWLQRFLLGARGTLLLVSHDREFLNNLVTSVVDIDHGRLVEYRGNYDGFLEAKAQRRDQLLAAKKNQDREVERQERFIERFRAKATKARQVQSRIKALEKIDRIQIETDPDVLSFRFPQPDPSGHRVVTLEGVVKRYGNLTVYDGLDFTVERGERLALVGPNGAGKSTLMKIVAGVLDVEKGRRTIGHNVQLAYYTQYRLDMLDSEATVLENAMRSGRRHSESVVRSVLGRFLFPGDEVFKRAGVLSGGEKSRLALVKILLNPPNLLMLDEPTIHLDIQSVQALIEALSGYTGTLITISHDVHFLRQTVNNVVRIEQGSMRRYLGGYAYYEEKWNQEQEALLAARTGETAPVKPPPVRVAADTSKSDPAAEATRGFKSKEQRRQEAEHRKRNGSSRRKLEQRLHHVEARVVELEAQQQVLVTVLEDPETYTRAELAQKYNRELQELQADLDRYNAEWEELVEELDGMD